MCPLRCSILDSSSEVCITALRTRFYSLEKEVELLRFANIERPAIPQDVGKQLEKAMLQVLEDPNATESKLLLVPMWLSQLPRTGKGEHIEVFGRILLDNRINDPWKLLDRVISNEADLTPMRDGLAKRYLRAAGGEKLRKGQALRGQATGKGLPSVSRSRW